METVSGVGGSLMRARPKAVAQIAIPVPTAGEQRRIVAKLDRLFKHTKTAREELSRIPRLVERQRGAILAAAVRGDLTQRWRANNGEINPASTRVPLQSDARSEVLLPKSWTNCRVGEAGEVTLGRQRSPRHHVGKDMRPYLRVANVFEARLDFRDVMEMNFTPSEFERFKLVPGDILLNEGQSKELVGRPAMFNGELDGVCFTNSLVRFRANSSVSAEYSLIVFRHYLRSGLFQTIANITTNIAHLGAGRFAALPFPTPPVAEQNEIVRICRYKFDALEKIASTVGQSSALIKRLEESALTYAFEGQLLM
jgi:type I restriction enzyme S subunit